MDDYEPHPNDTEELSLRLATEAVVRAKPANRYYIFPLRDRTEIAFGNSRHLTAGAAGEAFNLHYHTAVSLDPAMLREFHRALTTVVEALDETDG